MPRASSALHYILATAAAIFVAAFTTVVSAQSDVPTIAAASDLQFAMSDVNQAFAAETGREVKIAFGSSGNFFRQIQAGAPFQIFLSADEAFVEQLEAAHLTENAGDLYAVGRIAIVVPHGSGLKADGTLKDLGDALREGRVERFAIANPEHAPYGRRAEEALRHAGLWHAIQDKLVLGENVSQAAQFATSGGADGGIIAYSLALSPNVTALGDYALIPEDWHAPLRQRMVLLKGAGETARMFYAFVTSEAGRAILSRFGFVLPGESM
jgi:molybdate transport system substrate-binding protein